MNFVKLRKFFAILEEQSIQCYITEAVAES